MTTTDHPPTMPENIDPVAPQEYPLTPDQLAELHNPKSLTQFKNLFQDDPQNLFKYLNSSLQDGIKLTETETKNYRHTQRFKLYSDNRIPERVPKTFLQLIWEAFNDKTMLLLTAAAVVSFVLGLYEALYTPPEYDPEGNPIKKVDWIEGIAIMIAVIVVVFVGAVNDYQKELQFARLNKKKENRKIIVIRNSQELLTSIHNLLVGDIITLQTGDVIPADGVLVEGQCEVDESSITGESDTIKKVKVFNALKTFDVINEGKSNDQILDIGFKTPNGDKIPDCMLISGSKLLSGLGKAIITSVGTNSIHGRTMMALKVEPESTPLQQRLSQLADSISVYGCVAAILLFLVLFIRFLFYILAPNGRFHDLDPAQKGTKFLNIFITAVTIIVVAVPEGLPLAVTLALAFATTRMTKDGNLVRNLRACETMGSATAVCSDKTGTLTENVMSVVRGFVGDSYFNDSDNALLTSVATDSHIKKSIEIFKKNGECSENLEKDFLTNIVLNSTAFENKDFVDSANNLPFSTDERDPSQVKRAFEFVRTHTRISISRDDNSDSGDDLIQNAIKGRQEPYIGSKTETALLTLAKKSMNLRFGSLRALRENPVDRFEVSEIAQIIPFESTRKWGGIIVKYKESNLYRFFIKGAAEIVSNNCHSKRNSDDSIVTLNKDQINKEIENLANDALRALSLAHRDFPNCTSWPPNEIVDEKNPDRADPEKLLALTCEDDDSGLILDGIVGIMDPLREGVRNSVEQCQRAGVTVRMVTGDNILTARAIARNCNILSEETYLIPECAIEGPKFRTLTKQERIKMLPNLRVMARSSPEDKRLLVETLKGMGDVVAVTGDGTNDAPALKLADVGFSMGISGTEVAREASF